ncbi:protein NUCLEAR FUSION DEFECTIVE 6, mitochondrial-like isoform X2 [Bidens hawaiensis]|uniref:protein NUCLEAR FUSION DEFECTIVE 6, mitochondrial-like isoform X2 n=1 Tax=Bidens hawaiensis TaxID=980011 RepID=UPI00404A4BDD
MATTAAAVRSIFRSSSVRSAAARASTQAKAVRSPFRMANQNSLSNRIFSSPVELSACLESLQPFHTATASALMTSMLTLSQRGYGWLPEACNDDV